MDSKNYYLSSVRSTLIGIIVIVIGIAIFFIGYDVNNSYFDNFQNMFIDFRSVVDFFISLLLLLFKISFLLFGYIILKYREKIIRARIDNLGLYYKEITGSNRWDMLAFDLNKMTFLPYSKMISIRKVGFFYTYLEIDTRLGLKKLLTLNVLSRAEKEEIYNIIYQRIHSSP